jgi:hypothetical protein
MHTSALVDIPFSRSTVHEAVVVEVTSLLILQPLALFFLGLHSFKHDPHLRDLALHYVVEAGVRVIVYELPANEPQQPCVSARVPRSSIAVQRSEHQLSVYLFCVTADL